jgi:trehalose 6-phosphate phosphatase
MDYPAHPPAILLDDVALLLDVDGTLVDIAPRPDDVFVPAPLRQALQRLQERTSGALALVSGRPLADLDRLFAPMQVAAIGGHGAEIRPIAGGPVDLSHADPLDESLKARLAGLAAGLPGVLVEDKSYSLALHYRLAPEHEDAVREGVASICGEWPAGTINILLGKAVVEIKHAGVSKGLALRKLMAHPPFAGRTPIFIGDDTTDETAIAAVPEFDGYGYSVGRPIEGAVFQFSTPHDVRQWLEKISRDQL